MNRQAVVLLAVAFAITSVLAAPLDFPPNFFDFNEKDEPKENATEIAFSDDPLVNRPILLLNFFAPNVTVEHPEIESLEMTIEPSPLPFGSSSEEEATAYVEAARNLRAMAPNLRRVDFDGGFFFVPNESESEKPTEELLMEQLEYVHSNMAAVSKAFAAVDITKMSFDFTLWVYTKTNVTISESFSESVKKTFGDRHRLEVKEISADFKRLELSNNPFFEQKGSKDGFNYTIQMFVQRIGADCSSQLARLLPAGRSPVHRLPFAMLPWITNSALEMREVVAGMRRTWIQWINRHTPLTIGEELFAKAGSPQATFDEHIDRMADSINSFANGTNELQLIEELTAN
ncbi:hypothetical protein M3Y99_00288500 [Aphelenchoides fujianensis]|nr:hypothetical protein M3Y99_00288500 [Aphelenchoides fujianensis]